MECLKDAHGNIFWLQVIPGDGNCLYGALTHQLYGITPESDIFLPHCLQLRAIAVSEIRNNIANYYAYISVNANDVVHEHIPESEKVELYLQRLECSGFWGGEESLSAIANHFQICVTVYQENTQIRFLPRSEIECSTICHIFYRGFDNVKNHYDSVVCIRPMDVLLFSPDRYYDDCITIPDADITLKVQRLAKGSHSLFAAIGHQLTGSTPTSECVSILRYLVASELEKQPTSFRELCGIHCSAGDFSNVISRIQVGEDDGGIATLVSLTSLLAITIYVYSTATGIRRFDPVNKHSVVTIHILEDFDHLISPYASVIHLEHLSTEVEAKSPEVISPGIFTIAQRHEQQELAEPVISPKVTITISHSQGLRFATLNVNGCRMKQKCARVDEFLFSKNIYIAVLQEVNLQCAELDSANYKWYLGGPRTNQRRGLAILIRHGVEIEIVDHIHHGVNIQQMDILYHVSNKLLHYIFSALFYMLNYRSIIPLALFRWSMFMLLIET